MYQRNGPTNSPPATTEEAGRQSTPTTVVLHGRRLFVARAAWVALAALSVGLFVASVPVAYEPLSTYNVALSIVSVLGFWAIGALRLLIVTPTTLADFLCAEGFDRPLARAVLGGLLLVLLVQVVTLPLAAWRHTILVRYGLSTQSWGPWAVDVAKSAAVGAVLGGLALLGFFAVTRFAPRWWWAFGAAGAALLVVLLSFVLPVLVEPVFNKFTPMAASPLRTELLALAARDGVPVRDVLVADASRRTRAVNCNAFSGRETSPRFVEKTRASASALPPRKCDLRKRRVDGERLQRLVVAPRSVRNKARELRPTRELRVAGSADGLR